MCTTSRSRRPAGPGSSSRACGPQERHRVHAAARTPAACATARCRPPRHPRPTTAPARRPARRPRPATARVAAAPHRAGGPGRPAARGRCRAAPGPTGPRGPARPAGQRRPPPGPPRVRDQRHALERDPRFGCGDEPEVRAADHPDPGACGRGLGEQRHHQRGGPRRSRDRDRRTPPQPAGRKQRGQRCDHREHPGVRPRLDDRVRSCCPVLQAPQEPTGRRQPMRGVDLQAGHSTGLPTGLRAMAELSDTPSPTCTPPADRPRGRRLSN